MRFGAFIGELIGHGAGGKEGDRGRTEEGILAAAQKNYGIIEKDIMEITEDIPEGTADAILILSISAQKA